MDIASQPIPRLKKPLHVLSIHLARQYAKLYDSSKFIGVIGSVGKEAAVEACKSVLSQKYKTITTKSNIDPILNITKAILGMTPNIQKCVLEMETRYLGEMDFYLSLVKPKTVIVTNISYDDSQFLGSLEDVIFEKAKLLKQLPEDGVAILNWDDLETRKLSNKSKGSVVYFGCNPESCTIWAGNIKVEDFKTCFELNLGVERVRVTYNLLGKNQLYSALAAAALGVVFDIPLTKIKIALESIEGLEDRLQVVSGPSGSTILSDAYNSSPSTVEEAIETLIEIPARRRVAVIGEIRELGRFSDTLHRGVARKLYKEKIDLVFLGTGDALIIADELKNLGFLEERVEANLQNSQLVAKLLKSLGKGDVCLISGSIANRLDEVVKRIAKK